MEEKISERTNDDVVYCLRRLTELGHDDDYDNLYYILAVIRVFCLRKRGVEIDGEKKLTQDPERIIAAYNDEEARELVISCYKRKGSKFVDSLIDYFAEYAEAPGFLSSNKTLRATVAEYMRRYDDDYRQPAKDVFDFGSGIGTFLLNYSRSVPSTKADIARREKGLRINFTPPTLDAKADLTECEKESQQANAADFLAPSDASFLFNYCPLKSFTGVELAERNVDIAYLAASIARNGVRGIEFIRSPIERAENFRGRYCDEGYAFPPIGLTCARSGDRGVKSLIDADYIFTAVNRYEWTFVDRLAASLKNFKSVGIAVTTKGPLINAGDLDYRNKLLDYLAAIVKLPKGIYMARPDLALYLLILKKGANENPDITYIRRSLDGKEKKTTFRRSFALDCEWDATALARREKEEEKRKENRRAKMLTTSFLTWYGVIESREVNSSSAKKEKYEVSLSGDKVTIIVCSEKIAKDKVAVICVDETKADPRFIAAFFSRETTRRILLRRFHSDDYLNLAASLVDFEIKRYSLRWQKSIGVRYENNVASIEACAEALLNFKNNNDNLFALGGKAAGGDETSPDELTRIKALIIAKAIREIDEARRKATNEWRAAKFAAQTDSQTYLMKCALNEKLSWPLPVDTEAMKIFVCGAINGGLDDYYKTAKGLSIKRNNLNMKYIGYDRIRQYDIAANLRYSPAYSDIIFGALPHSNAGKYNVVNEIARHPEQYPHAVKARKSGGALGLTKSSFKKALLETRFYEALQKKI